MTMPYVPGRMDTLQVLFTGWNYCPKLCEHRSQAFRCRAQTSQIATGAQSPISEEKSRQHQKWNCANIGSVIAPTSEVITTFESLNV